MARLDELAEGLANLLIHSPTPEPLRVDLMNHSPVEATVLVRAVVDACQRGRAPLAAVRIGPQLGSRLLREHGDAGQGYEGISITPDPALKAQIEFFRSPPNS